MESRTVALDRLFARWQDTFPDTARSGFHADGIIHEDAFFKAPRRLLFVMAEPNSTGGAYQCYRGDDLRRVYRDDALNKMLTRNLGLWTSALLDGVSEYRVLDGVKAQSEIRRIAIMNLKKFSGSGNADYASIGLHAWQDRAFIREEVALIEPRLILTCGKSLHRLFGCVMHDDRFWIGDREWRWNNVPVVSIQHPSTRGRNVRGAFEEILELERRLRSGRL